MQFKQRTIAILGHTSFIGQTIHQQLAREGFSVLGVSSQECNLLDYNQTSQFMQNLPIGSQVIFCATISRVVEDSYEAMQRNIQMVQNFLMAIPSNLLGGVVFLSSVDVYGRMPKLPITEQTLPNPANYYGIAKVASEYLMLRPSSLECPVTVLRLPGIYGPEDKGRSVVGRFIQQIMQQKPIIIDGDGSVQRDFVLVDDVCQVVRYLLDQPYHGALNLATGTSLSIKEIVQVLGEVVGQSPMIEYRSANTQVAGDLKFDVTLLCGYLPHIQLKSLKKGAIFYVSEIGKKTHE